MTAPSADLPRHTLVRVDPAAWTHEIALRKDLIDAPLVAEWAKRGWPLVARRRLAKDRTAYIPLGLPLPPAHGKGRIAVDLPLNAVRMTEPPPPLAACRETAPRAWHESIDALLDLGERCGADIPRVFGSFAWAALTGLAYVTDTSDLDLIWTMPRDLDSLLETLAAIHAVSPGGIDGEIVDETGAAVQWRELASGNDEVLAKTSDGVALIPRARFCRRGIGVLA